MNPTEPPPGIGKAGIGGPSQISQSGLNDTTMNSDVKDKYEKTLQVLATARTDVAKMKTEMQQLDENLDENISLEKADQAIAAMEKSKRIHEKICGLSFNRTTIQKLRNLYSEGQIAIENQIQVEKELEERKKMGSL
ncbi:hypothetical protein B9Z55_016592 [Caenorhabditis nigoni]|uniref:Uncharacterized protein n=1 Tax=Caenorhabditis nigoni TaxID=1611254 RepID=A0A2G5T671_9PELO|nr:hypothetical protein B9Z55_016592 [Caenorhabditis nigoni]